MVSNCIRYLSLVVMLCLSTAGVSQEDWNSITVIGNSTGEKSISKKALIEVFRGQRNYWKSDESVLLVLPSDKHKGAKIASYTLYKMSISEMQKFWLALVFQGRANPPVFNMSNEDILQLVSETPGAIGILINFQGVVPNELLINID